MNALKFVCKYLVLTTICYMLLTILWVGLEYIVDGRVDTSKADTIVCILISCDAAYSVSKTIATQKKHRYSTYNK